MNILQLTKKFPYPLKDGEAWAVLGLAKGLKAQGCTIDLLSITEPNWSQGRQTALDILTIYQNMDTIAIDTKVSISSALLNLFTAKSYHADRFDCQEVQPFIEEVVAQNKYDLVIFETAFLLPYIDVIREVVPACNIIVRTHNVEHLIWQRYASQKTSIKKWYFNNQSERLKRFEKTNLPKTDGLLALSEIDLRHFIDMGVDIPAMVCPIGMSMNDVTPRHKEDRPLIIGFIGSLDWRPNIEGIEWFLKEVWGNVQDLDFESSLMIAGRNVGNKVWKNHPKVTFMGEIDDSDLFLQRIDLLVVPLWSGSGTRVKILQAFRNATPVLSTSIGIEGIEVSPNIEALISDDASEWIDLITKFHNQDFNRIDLATRASNYLQTNHNPDLISKKVLSFVSNL